LSDAHANLSSAVVGSIITDSPLVEMLFAR
jgi:hypothetical protein